MGLIRFIQDHNRNVALKRQAEAKEELVREMERHNAICDSNELLRKENMKLKMKIETLENVIQKLTKSKDTENT